MRVIDRDWVDPAVPIGPAESRDSRIGLRQPAALNRDQSQCKLKLIPVVRDWVNPVKQAQYAAQLAEQGYETASSAKQSYEAAASSAGVPMMLRNLSISRDSSRETCIWLMPSSRGR